MAKLCMKRHYCEGAEENDRKTFKVSKGWLASYVKHCSCKKLKIREESALTDAKVASALPEVLK